MYGDWQSTPTRDERKKRNKEHVLVDERSEIDFVICSPYLRSRDVEFDVSQTT